MAKLRKERGDCIHGRLTEGVYRGRADGGFFWMGVPVQVTSDAPRPRGAICRGSLRRSCRRCRWVLRPPSLFLGAAYAGDRQTSVKLYARQSDGSGYAVLYDGPLPS